MIDFHIIEHAVQFNCETLGVSPPRVTMLPASSFSTLTTFAAISPDGEKLAINSSLTLSKIDIWFAISHELRHKWQIDHDWDFGKYQKSDVDFCNYNRQPQEIDAPAWATIVLANLFHLRPKLAETLGNDVWGLIVARAKEIEMEYYQKYDD